MTSRRPESTKHAASSDKKDRSVDKQVDWPTSTTDHPSSASSPRAFQNTLVWKILKWPLAIYAGLWIAGGIMGQMEPNTTIDWIGAWLVGGFFGLRCLGFACHPDGRLASWLARNIYGYDDKDKRSGDKQ